MLITPNVNNLFSINRINQISNKISWTFINKIGIINIKGNDSIEFSHNQFTNDIRNLDYQNICSTAICAPNGKILASCIAYKTENGIHLLISKDIQFIIQEYLSKFILRSSVNISSINESFVLIGFFCKKSESFREILNNSYNLKIYEKIYFESNIVLRISDSMQYSRYIFILNKKKFNKYILYFNKFIKVHSDIWDWLDIHSCQPRITKLTSGKFIPQDINYDLIGGINFKKGCYPGQEIIARIHYKNLIKNRMVLMRIKVNSFNIYEGIELFLKNDITKQVGVIVNYSRISDNTIDILAKILIKYIDYLEIVLKDSTEINFIFLPMPYSLNI